MKVLAGERLTKQLSRRMNDLAFNDTCSYVAVGVGSYNEYGEPVESNTTTTGIACSFTDSPDMEQWRDFGDVSVIAAEIRQKTVVPTSGSRFTLTGRFGTTTYVDQTFEIVGIRNRDVFGYVCALKLAQIG